VLRRPDLDLIDLWILYRSRGGHCHPLDFDAFIHDVLPAAGFDVFTLADALDEPVMESASQ
jgi:hypothetical protein